MNDIRSFEATVAERVAGEGVAPPSDDFYERLISSAEQQGQRPRWLALLKEPPMRLSSSVAVGSPTARLMAISVATILATLLVVSAGVAGARLFAADGPIVVDQSGNGTVETITEAVAMAEDGDEILIRPGTYPESIRVDKDISITGAGEPGEVVVEIPDDGPTDVTIFGSTKPRYAFYLDGTEATVGNLTVTGPQNRVAAFVVNGGSPTIHDIVANLEAAGAIPLSFVLMDGGSGLIRDNITDMFLWVDGGATPEIVDNVSTDAIRTNGSGTDPWIHGNHATGIWAHGGSSPLVEDNDISGSTGRDCGIEAGGIDTRPTLRANRASGNDVGVCAYDGGRFAELSGNVISANAVGLRIASASDVPDLAGNTICGNDVNIVGLGDDTPTDEELCADG